VFTKVIPTNVPNFVAFLFTGIVAWNWFATGLTLSAQSLEARRDLVVRPGFPSALLPLVAVTVGFVDYLLALPVLLLVVGLSVGFHATLALLPVLLAIQFLLTIGLGWIIAPLNVFFRDVAHLVGVLLLLGFFITPIFYSRSQTPARFAPLYDFNPMGQLIEAQRKILLDGHLPAFMPVALVAAASVGIFALGFAVFAATRHSLPDQL
jgi:lipopolysaccharide transport system permease protein